MSEETLKIVVPVFAAVLAAFVTYYLTRSHYDRKRQDDLADRDFIRRAAIHDMRIKDAREVVNTWGLLNSLMSHGNDVFIEESSMERKNEHLNYLAEKYANLPSLLTNMSNQQAGIDILNDAELTSLQKELFSTMYIPMKNLWEITDKLFADEKLDVKDMKVNDFSDVITKADILIVRMKARLDKLAEKVP